MSDTYFPSKNLVDYENFYEFFSTKIFATASSIDLVIFVDQILWSSTGKASEGGVKSPFFSPVPVSRSNWYK